MLLLVIGPTMGFLAFALEELSSELWEWRASALEHPTGEASFHGWLGFSCWNLALALCACIACVLMDDPASKGSGIPEVKGH